MFKSVEGEFTKLLSDLIEASDWMQSRDARTEATRIARYTRRDDLD